MKAKKHAAELIKRQTSQIDKFNQMSSNKTSTPIISEKKNNNSDNISLDDSSSTDISTESMNSPINNNNNTNVDNLLAKFRQQQSNSSHHIPKPQGYSTPKSNILQNKTKSTSPYRIPSHSNPLYLNNSNSLNAKTNNKQETQSTMDNSINISKSNEISTYKKRKRETYDMDDEEFRRRVQKKLDTINDDIDRMDEETENSNSDLYSLFNDLQGISADFGISFETPELVVVGMQSGIVY